MLVTLSDGLPTLALGLQVATIAGWALAGGRKSRALVLALAGDITVVFAAWILFWSLGGTFSIAYGVGRDGRVAGGATLANGNEHPFLWSEHDGMRDLGTLGGPNGNAAGPNGKVYQNINGAAILHGGQVVQAGLAHHNQRKAG